MDTDQNSRALTDRATDRQAPGLWEFLRSDEGQSVTADEARMMLLTARVLAAYGTWSDGQWSVLLRIARRKLAAGVVEPAALAAPAEPLSDLPVHTQRLQLLGHASRSLSQARRALLELESLVATVEV